jgi:hypothetical protein
MGAISVLVLLLLVLVVFAGAFAIAVMIPFWKSTSEITVNNGDGSGTLTISKPQTVISNAEMENIPLALGTTSSAGVFSGIITLHVLSVQGADIMDINFVAIRQSTGASQLLTISETWKFAPGDRTIETTLSVQSQAFYLNVANPSRVPRTLTMFLQLKASPGPQKVTLQ